MKRILSKPSHRLSLALAVLLGGCLGTSASIRHAEHGTWSLVAADPPRREVGVALASCVAGSAEVSVRDGGYRVSVGGGAFDLAHLQPGLGAVVAQAQVDAGNAARLDRAAQVLKSRSSPQDAIAAAREGDPGAETRQYGAVTTTPLASAFTGRGAIAWAGHTTGRLVAVQGNILVGPEVVSEALRAFEATRARLADALLAGLKAGAAAGGDRRCPPSQGALTAFLVVAAADDAGPRPRVWAAVLVREGGEPPVEALARVYEGRRQIEPLIEDRVLVLVGVVLVLALAIAGIWLGRRRAS